MSFLKKLIKPKPPAVKPAAEPRQPVPSPELAAPPEPEPVLQSTGPRILLVDDDPIILKTTSQKLRAAGYSMATAVDAAAAISAVRKVKPDLLILDVNFPPDVAHGGAVAWDGFLMSSWLRRLDETKDVPIIVISATDSAKVKEQARAGGALAFFSKPLDHAALVEAVQRALPVNSKTDDALAIAPTGEM